MLRISSTSASSWTREPIVPGAPNVIAPCKVYQVYQVCSNCRSSASLFATSHAQLTITTLSALFCSTVDILILEFLRVATVEVNG
jgi:hypothetical protein